MEPEPEPEPGPEPRPVSELELELALASELKWDPKPAIQFGRGDFEGLRPLATVIYRPLPAIFTPWCPRFMRAMSMVTS